jgi:hypothetical protein
MRLRLAGGLDLATGALILGGAGLVAASIVAAVVLLAAPPMAAPPDGAPAPTPRATSGRPSQTLPADRVAAVLYVDAETGAGAAARSGDHVDILGYFSRQVTGDQSVTRTLLLDVPVLAADRAGGSVALTLAVPQDQALLLQEAQVLGAHPFVTLRPMGSTTTSPRATFTDADVAARLAGAR